MVSEERAKELRDLAIGQNVNLAGMPLEAQMGAIRKQVLKISVALGIELDEDFVALEAAVEAARQ
jgi:hypothetical protein